MVCNRSTSMNNPASSPVLPASHGAAVAERSLGSSSRTGLTEATQLNLVERLASWRRHVVERLGPAEIRRRLWHMLPGVLPVLFWLLPHTHPLSMFWRVMFVA